MNKPRQDGMWGEEDGFYNDLFRLPDGSATRLKMGSIVCSCLRGRCPSLAPYVLLLEPTDVAARRQRGLMLAIPHARRFLKTHVPAVATR